jgi:hypothetical protein
MSHVSIDDPLAAVAERAPRTERKIAVTPSGVTRYLAAAAYTDKAFRDRAIEIDRAEFRAVAPELGIDAAAVVEHCHIARRREALRDAALCLILIVLAATGIFGELIDSPQYFSEILLDYSTSIAWCSALAVAVVFADTFLREHITLTQRLALNSSSRSPKIPALTPTKRGNVVVYGAFSPFVGSGFDLGGWSFTVNLEQAKLDGDESTSVPFEIRELYDALRSGFERLSIDGLSVSDRLFVDGRSIRDDRRFLTHILSRPVTDVDAEAISLFEAHPEKTVRHYLCLEICDWSGELVLSNFIRLHKTGSKLFVETSSFILPPLKRQYYELDKYAPTRMVRKTFQWLVQSVIVAPFLMLFAVFTTWRTLSRPMNLMFEHRRHLREVRYNPLHNYGATQSIRESGTENSWRVYFQKLDKEMHTKIVQQQMLDVLISFLDDHGIDTSEIKDRGTHILNNGVIVSGGMISAEGLAVGQGAQASVSKRGHVARGKR